MSYPINTSNCKAIISSVSKGVAKSVLFNGGLFGRVAYFDGSVSLKTVKLDPTSDNSVSFSFFAENVSSSPRIISDFTTERMLHLYCLSNGSLILGTTDSSGFTQTTLLPVGGIVDNTIYRVNLNYTVATKTWSASVNGSATPSHTHSGTFTLANFGDITLADSASGAGVNLVGSIWDVNINNTNAYAGHGPAVGNWVDLIGSDVISPTDIAKLTLYTGSV